MLFGLLFAFAIYTLYMQEITRLAPADSWVTTLASTCSVATGVCQTISGVVLIKSVFDIYNFFKQRGDESHLNFLRLLRHALAYGLFLASNALYLFSDVLRILWPHNDMIFRISTVINDL